MVAIRVAGPAILTSNESLISSLISTGHHRYFFITSTHFATAPAAELLLPEARV